MAGWRAVACVGAFCGVWCVSIAGQEGRPAFAGAAPHVYISDSLPRFVVERAVRGAAARLRRQDCLRILDDFPEPEGRRLSASLQSSTVSADEYLITRVWFVDGIDERNCRKAGAPAAFTTVGSRVIRICSVSFGRLLQDSVTAEMLIIHEFLHTLGLGEDPPSSREITRRVRKRCGGN